MHDHYPWEASNIDKLETKMAFDDTIVITVRVNNPPSLFN